MIRTIDLQFLNSDHTIAAYLVETGNGLTLVETGPYSTFTHLLKGLKDLGYRPEDITHVLLTHIHLDHAGAAWALAERGATIYVHPLGARHLHNPSRLMQSAKQIYREQMDTLWGKMKAIPSDQLRRVEHGQSLRLGDTNWRALHTPGHAIHHVAWKMESIIFTGDVAGVRIGDGPVVPPCPPADIHIEDWQNSIQILRTAAPEILYLTHFGPVTDTGPHLNELESRLLKWANWMRPHYESGAQIEEIAPAFQKFVREQLQEAGATKEQMEKYELANPSWMSVPGLLRYWRKKLDG